MGRSICDSGINARKQRIILTDEKDMKTFRIVKEWVERKGKELVQFKVEQRHHFMWLFHWWKAPKFAANELFAYPNTAEDFILSYYPDAVIHDCYSDQPKVGG